MGLPAFLVLNYCNVRQFPDYVLDANEEDTGAEVERVANGRRSNLNFWTPTTPNSQAWVRIDAGSGNTLAPTGFALDRGHNLAGKSVYFESSTSPDSGYVTLANPTIPSTPASGGDLDAANGITTDEGAWVKRISAPTARRYLRFRVPAMGTGLRPRVVGLWFGLWWSPGQVYNPLTDEDLELVSDRIETKRGWGGSTRETRVRVGELVLQLESDAEYDSGAAVHVRDQFLAGRLMWIVHNDDKAERAVLSKFPGGRSGFRYGPGWSHRQGVIPWREWQPLIEEP